MKFEQGSLHFYYAMSQTVWSEIKVLTPDFFDLNKFSHQPQKRPQVLYSK